MTTISLAMPKSHRPQSLWAFARGRFLRNRLAVIGGVVTLLLIIVCYAALPYWIAAPAVGGAGRYAYQDLHHVLAGPSAQHWLGTDMLGRDLLGRLLVGGAVSLGIGLSSAAIAVAIGTSVGMIAGYAGGRIDAVLMRIVDTLYGLPYILLVILMRISLVPLVMALLAGTPANPSAVPPTAGTPALVSSPALWANVLVLLVGIGAVSWLTMARVIRGQTMSLRDQPFVEAARALGLRHRTIILKHILPNLVGPILVYATLTVPAAILSESFLSFLGLGIEQPLPSWGNLASDGVAALSPVHVYWWVIVFPCGAISLALLCLNFMGDGLRDALDPKG